MNGLRAMLGKELLELRRTRRLLVLGAAFFLLGAVSPITAKYMPLLIKNLGSPENQGFEITVIREPVPADALFQYIKNFMLFPLLAILMSMGSISSEFSRNIAPLVLAKPVGIWAYVTSKLITMALGWLAGLVISSGFYLFYTYVLFHTVPDLAGFFLMNIGFWALLLLFTSLTLSAGTFFEGPAPTAGVGIAFYVLVVVLGQYKGASSFLPCGLNGSHASSVGLPIAPFATTMLLTFLFLWVAVRGVLRRRLR
ncbi:MAG: hypothetical protein Kow00107_03890 [Planctomycetota bacterium]